MKVIKDVMGYTYTLSTKRLAEKSDPCKRYVILSELKAVLPKTNGKIVGRNPYKFFDSIYPKILHRRRFGKYHVEETWITVGIDGRLSIGCKDFGVAASRAIYKAMGVLRKVQ